MSLVGPFSPQRPEQKIHKEVRSPSSKAGQRPDRCMHDSGHQDQSAFPSQTSMSKHDADTLLLVYPFRSSLLAEEFRIDRITQRSWSGVWIWRSWRPFATEPCVHVAYILKHLLLSHPRFLSSR